MMSPFFRYLILVVCFVSANKLSATHIMGGELNYEYISENFYKISMVYYVDCENGNASAISSDQFAIFGFFNAKTGDFIEKVEIERSEPVRVSKLNYTCVTQPPNACVDRYDYTFTKSIDPGEDGLIVSFQRCCRNHTITNLIDPGATGMTLYAKIPPKQEVKVNSNPVFKDNPPNFLCNNAPLIFDHSATDKDGDSLVYELFIPYLGATTAQPRPSQPSNPPYAKVTYTASYNITNLMGGVEKLAIDRHTGKLTVWPDKVGQYVVGIIVSEYRDGKKVGETLRDYQFNVLNCVFGIQAMFTIPELDCVDTAFTVTNLSENALTYNWNFDVDNNTAGTSTDFEPTVVYPEKGTYTIKLVAHNKDCKDSISKTVKIGHQDSIQASFSLLPDTVCAGGKFTITNTSDDTPDWYWDLGQGFGEKHNVEINDFVVVNPGDYTVRLRILDSLNCMAQKIATKDITVLPNIDQQAGFSLEFPDKCNPGLLIATRTDTITESWTWDIGGVPGLYPNTDRIVLRNLNKGKLAFKLSHDKAGGKCTTNYPAEDEVDVAGLESILEDIELVNIFTPNNDGLNDCYQLTKEGDCFDLDIIIYSRWGEIVYDSKTADKACWDGKRPTGETYPDGTYFGIITLSNDDLNYSETLSVTVTLIR